LMRKVKMVPVRLKREIDGFVINRLQGALLREAYCLVRDGVATPAEIDRLIRDALGLRWSVLGAFETSHLNTRGGIAAHAERMGPAYHRMAQQRGQSDSWPPEMVATVAADLEARRPLSD
jgi:L-gulonate 3-dehydrogenase